MAPAVLASEQTAPFETVKFPVPSLPLAPTTRVPELTVVPPEYVLEPVMFHLPESAFASEAIFVPLSERMPLNTLSHADDPPRVSVRFEADERIVTGPTRVNVPLSLLM